MIADVLNQADSRPGILIIYTGGTIGMIEDEKSGCLRPFDFSHLIDNVPKLKKLNYTIDNVSFSEPIDSSDMNPEHWTEIVKIIETNYDNYDGFVVLHGTDTMAYSASALSFMLENLRKPVIITGSQLPIGEVRTDGEENLITAVQIAAARNHLGQPMVQEVAILFENYLWRGNRSTKKSADNFNAFKSNNYPPLARIGLGINFNEDALYRLSENRGPLRVHYNMCRDVMFVDLFPGLKESTLRYLFNTPGIKGIVMRTYGAGNAMTSGWFCDCLSEATARGIVILNVTQCVNGAVHRRYESSDALLSAGVVSGRDITAEAAITKMMYLFGLGLDTDHVKRVLSHPLCGEVSTLQELAVARQ